MDRNEFISILRAALSGQVPDAVTADNVSYYDHYISQEIAGGKSEQEVLESLGDPRLIAKTIIDMQEEPEEVHGEYRQDSGSQPQYQQDGRGNLFNRILVIALIILILTAVFRFVGWILPIVLPVLVIWWIVRIIFRDR